MSIDRGIDKEGVVCVCVCVYIYIYIYIYEFYSAMKKNEKMPFSATSMYLNILILSKVSQTEKDKYHRIWLICGILKTGTSEVAYKQK